MEKIILHNENPINHFSTAFLCCADILKWCNVWWPRIQRKMLLHMPIIHSRKKKSHTFNLGKFYFVNRAICSCYDFLLFVCLSFIADVVVTFFLQLRTHYIPFHFFKYICHYYSSARGQSKQLNGETNCV